MPPIWKKKPIHTNLISPKEASATPKTMIRTLRRTLSFGFETPNAQVVMRTAKGAPACEGC